MIIRKLKIYYSREPQMEPEQPPTYSSVHPPSYITVRQISSIQPVQTVIVRPNTVENHKSHLCMCERGCVKVINFCCCFPDDSHSDRNNQSTCKNLADFRVYCGSYDDGICLGLFCFPVSLVRKLIFELPCVSFCRNKCNGTDDLNYMC